MKLSYVRVNFEPSLKKPPEWYLGATKLVVTSRSVTVYHGDARFRHAVKNVTEVTISEE